MTEKPRPATPVMRARRQAIQAHLDAIEAAHSAEESLRERVMWALFFADAPWMPAVEFDAGTTDPRVKARLEALADAAIDALRGRAETAELALASLRARVRALAGELGTRYPDAPPELQSILRAVATDIRATITDALRGNR
jgi:undecaprenyl pyrophosphate synthase